MKTSFDVETLMDLVLECKRCFVSNTIADDDSAPWDFYSGILQGLYGCVMVLSDNWDHDVSVLSHLVDEYFPF